MKRMRSVVYSRSLPFGAVFCVLLSLGQAAWMEEISGLNTQDDKARIEAAYRNSTNQSVSTQANLKYAVSLIEAVLKKGASEVKVTWMDIDDTAANYRIYRHTDPITSEAVMQKAKYLGSVRAGVQQYVD